MDDAVLNQGDRVILLTQLDAKSNRRSVTSWLHVHAATDLSRWQIAKAVSKATKGKSR